MSRAKTIGYWFFTLVIAWEMAAGSMWDLLQIEFVRGVFDRLGYPHYMLFIIGAWKLPCALVLLAPRLPTLKEWAYAGAVFNYTGAAASHLFAHEGPAAWAGPAVFAVMTMASWALRPAEKRLAPLALPALKPVKWLVPAGIGAAMVLLALVTLPKGR
ncbi:MAG: DoxX family protein [Myxococcaceae bacterium]